MKPSTPHRSQLIAEDSQPSELQFHARDKGTHPTMDLSIITGKRITSLCNLRLEKRLITFQKEVRRVAGDADLA